MSIIDTLRDAARKHVAYRRTVFELRGISGRIAEDIAVWPGDEKIMARRAVYG